jgi:hypothetical protein
MVSRSIAAPTISMAASTPARRIPQHLMQPAILCRIFVRTYLSQQGAFLRIARRRDYLLTKPFGFFCRLYRQKMSRPVSGRFHQPRTDISKNLHASADPPAS